jgi:hypothetical protein
MCVRVMMRMLLLLLQQQQLCLPQIPKVSAHIYYVKSLSRRLYQQLCLLFAKKLAIPGLPTLSFPSSCALLPTRSRRRFRSSSSHAVCHASLRHHHRCP